jgi:hypothetical protein
MDVILKPYDLTDLLDHFIPLHKKYYTDDYPLPIMNNIVDARILKNGNGASAVGVIKVFMELILAMDLDAMRVKRVKNVDSLIKELVLIAKDKGIEQIHAFPNESFAEYLVKHYGFEKCPGVPIVLNLNGGNVNG